MQIMQDNEKEFPLDVKGLQFDVFINYIQGCPFHIVEGTVNEVLGKYQFSRKVICLEQPASDSSCIQLMIPNDSSQLAA
jgi:hypothetical protein